MKTKIPGLNRFAYGELRLARIEALSDGVFAFVMTVLVLELRVPVLDTFTSTGELWAKLQAQLPKFISWLISFFIVIKFWINHHHTLSFARHATYGLVWLNALFLMSQAFIPFPTALMGTYVENPLAVALFGCVMATSTLIFIGLHAYIMNNLLLPERADKQNPANVLKAVILPLGYVCGAALAFISVTGAFLFYAITPLFSIVPPGWNTLERQNQA